MEKQNIKNIEIGNFYLIHDGSKTGHPGLIIWKNDDVNLYLAIKIGTSSNKNNKKLVDALSAQVIQHYICVKPFLGKRKDFGSKAFLDLHITEELKCLCDEIKKLKPTESKNINRRDRRNYIHLYKQK